MQPPRRSPGTWPDVRVACVWLPELPMRVEVLRNPGLAGRPLVVGGGAGAARVVTLCSPDAARAGIRPGLPLREVLSLCPDAVVLPPDPIRTAGVLDAVAGALEQVSPIVELGDEALYLDLRGLRQLYRDDLATLARAIHAAVPPLLRPRLGVAAGKFAALVAARTAPAADRPANLPAPKPMPGQWSGAPKGAPLPPLSPGAASMPEGQGRGERYSGKTSALTHDQPSPSGRAGYLRRGAAAGSPLPLGEGQGEGVSEHSGDLGGVDPHPGGTPSPYPSPRGRGDTGQAPSRDCAMHVVPAGRTGAFLAPLGLDHLPLPPAGIEWLRRLGIGTIGELAALPAGAVQAQLGPAGGRAWRLANGRDDEPVVPRRANLSVRTALRVDDPLASVDAIFFALDQLLGRVYGDPLMRSRAARQVRLAALLVDGTTWERVITFKEPLASRASALVALKHRLAAANAMPPAPIEELVVELRQLGGALGQQTNLFASQARAQDPLVEATQRLAVRYDRQSLHRAVPVERWSRIPENRWVLVPLEQSSRHQSSAALMHTH